MQIETFNPIPEGSITHGYSGPIQVSRGGINFGVGSQFLDVGKLYDPDRPQVDDNNDFETPNAYSVSVFTNREMHLPSWFTSQIICECRVHRRRCLIFNKTDMSTRSLEGAPMLRLDTCIPTQTIQI